MATKLLAGLMVGALVTLTSPIFAADQDRDRDRDRDQLQDPDQLRDRDRDQLRDRDVYGYQLMTEQERTAYRARMRTATTAEERQRIRAEHHEQMKKRAAERGVKLPDEPPMPPMHKMGPGAGPGSMGPGGGGMR